MTTPIPEIRYAVRALAKAPAFALAAVSTLGLGIAVTTMLFSVLHAVVLRPLPYREPSRLEVLWEVADDGKLWRPSPDAFHAWRDGTRAFESLAAFSAAGHTLTGSGEPTPLRGARVTPNYFDVLGVSPSLGRGFTADEGRGEGARVVVLGHDLWISRFGADPGILGRAITLDGEPYTVVGVTPPAPYPSWPLTTGQIAFQKDLRQYFVPRSLDGIGGRPGRSHVLGVIGRLKPGVDRLAAQSEISAIEHGRHAADPESSLPGARLRPLGAETTGAAGKALWLLFGAVAFVLAIGCANVAGLALARGESRSREVAIRSALGAGRARIVRQMLTESVLISLAAGALGVALSVEGLPLLLSLVPGDLPRLSEAGIHGGTLAFAVFVSVFVGIGSGLAPALLATRHDGSETLRSHGSTESRRARRVLRLLVLGEVGLSVLLVAAASLLTRSYLSLQSVDPGFRAPRLLVATVSVPRERYSTWRHVARFHASLLDAVRALPGVESAALAYDHPLEANWIGGADLEPAPDHRSAPESPSWFRAVSERYFGSIGVSFVAGRDFDAGDDAAHPGVAIVNEAFARRYFRDGTGIGRRLVASDAMQWWGAGLPERFEIIGVVRNVRFLGLDKEAEPAYYLSVRQFPIEDMKLVVRTAGDPAGAIPGIRRVLGALDPALPLANLQTMSRVYDGALAPSRLNMRLMLLFGAAALALAMLGVYGLLSYLVTLRTREIGVRVALGARPRQVVRNVLGETARLAAGGAALGLAGSLALAPLLRSLLFGVTATDAVSLAAAPLLLGLVALAASGLPARRAARIDPMTALRTE